MGKREVPLEGRGEEVWLMHHVTKPRSPYATLPRDVISRVASFTMDTAPSPVPTEKEPVTWAFMCHFPTTGDVAHLVPASPLAQHASSRLASRLEEDKQLFFPMLGASSFTCNWTATRRAQKDQAFPGRTVHLCCPV